MTFLEFLECKNENIHEAYKESDCCNCICDNCIIHKALDKAGAIKEMSEL